VRFIRTLLRNAVGGFMENLFAGFVALLLFGYLIVAMIRPEKF
jgi:K+-transporting ATPase KdpF subunit